MEQPVAVSRLQSHNCLRTADWLSQLCQGAINSPGKRRAARVIEHWRCTPAQLFGFPLSVIGPTFRRFLLSSCAEWVLHSLLNCLPWRLYTNAYAAQVRRDHEGGELDSYEELGYHLRVQASSRGGRWCWTLKRAQEDIKSREVELNPQESPGRDQEEGGGAGPSREPEEIKRREMELDPQESPRRDQEQGGGAGLRKLDCPLLQLFPNSCATDIVLATLLRTAVETAISGVH